jgi:CheY-like chemotaxis protein
VNKSWDLSDLKVLVVEDDGDTHELLRTALESRGATVYEAEEILTAQE